MVRDGRDVVSSLRNRTGKFEESVERWLNDNLAGKHYWNHPSVKVVRLEDLVKSPELVLNEICNFINEVSEADKMLNYHKSKQTFYDPKKNEHSNLRDNQLKQPLFKNTSRWERELTESELLFFKNRAGELMKEFKYTA
jgi:hypothetical protein